MTNQSIVVNFDGQYFSGALVRIPAISGRDRYQNPQYHFLSTKEKTKDVFYNDNLVNISTSKMVIG
jgi:hypothetical protein